MLEHEQDRFPIEGDVTQDSLVLEIIPPHQEYITTLQARGKEHHAATYTAVVTMAQAVREQGGRALLVGGSVRDMVLDFDPKDFDIEIYGLTAEQLEMVAQDFGKVSAVGKAFGILKVSYGNGIDLDLSLPREDSKVGSGHRGFAIKTNPYMSIEQAARRRDFTFNSMAADPLTGELFDPHGGLEDLRGGILRVTDAERFGDDPLRVMRALQFAGRFNMIVEPESMEIMRAMVPQLTELPTERFLEEWKKLLLKSENPSIGLQLGMELGVFATLYPEFTPLMTTPQEPEFHPEGDVWTHTLMVIDQAAKIAKREHLPEEQALVLLLAALTHDMGKPATTVVTEEGRITSYGHETAGIEPAARFLAAVGTDTETGVKILKLVEQHMWPHSAYASEAMHGQAVSNGAFRKLATRLHPATISELALLAEADHAGTGFFVSDDNPNELVLPEVFGEGDWLRARAANVNVASGKPEDIVRGKDLIAHGLKPGRDFGDIIALCNQLRDEKELSREEILALLAGIQDTNDALLRFTRGLVSS